MFLLISRQIQGQDLYNKICEAGYNRQMMPKALSFAMVLRAFRQPLILTISLAVNIITTERDKCPLLNNGASPVLLSWTNFH
jgi:hypothetical protein